MTARMPRRLAAAAGLRSRRNAAFALLRRQLEQPVGRASQFESAAGLQALAFQPYAHAPNLGFDQWSTLDQAGNALRGRQNVVAGNF